MAKAKWAFALILGIAASVPQAQAALYTNYIETSLDGINWTIAASGAGVQNYSGTVGSLAITQSSVFTITPGGTANKAQQQGGSLDVANNTGSLATVWIAFVSQDFSLPVTPPALNFVSNVSGTVGTPNSTLSFYSCVDTTNGGGIGTPCPGGSITSAASNPNIANPSWSDTKKSLINSLSAPYAISEILTVTLGAGEDLNFSSSTTLTPVPEPVSILLLGGVILFTSKTLRRKSKLNS